MNNIGVVIKIEGKEAVVMTDICTFERVKVKEDMFPGQKILVDKEEISDGRHLKQYLPALAGVAAAIFVMVFSYFRFFYISETYAYIDVDINPSFEIAIDRDEKVRDLNPINKDAEVVIAEVKLDGLGIKEALRQLINVTKEHGFIDEKGRDNIVLISAALEERHNSIRRDHIGEENRIDNMLEDIKTDLGELYGNSIKPYAARMPSDFKAKSRENNISMGKYYVLKRIIETGKSISLEELNSEDLYKILENNGIGLFNVERAPEPTLSDADTVTKTPTVTPTLTTPTPTTPKPTPTTPTPTTPTPTTPRITPTPAQSIDSPQPSQNKVGGEGLRGEYYANMDLTQLKSLRIDSVINFDWGEGSPHESIGSDYYSIRWTGKIEPSYTETYTFYTNTDDGVRLWVDNVLIIDKWKSQSATEYRGTIDLIAGKKYEIKMEYYDHRRGASAKLMWSSKSQVKEIIPEDKLYPPEAPLPPQPDNGIRAQYFNDTELKNLKLTRVDSVIDFDWMRQPPVSETTDERFSVRWTGKLTTRYSEEYTFYTLVDDGVRLWVNDVLIIDKWSNQKNEMEWSGKIKLEAHRQYNIKIEYFNGGGPSSMKLMWSSGRQKKQIVPEGNLFEY